uniref:PH domain-containing protein n=1 Tax=Globisporangium ultimum (strain ATCC 200006 / CBS 805.95 / DAOM BR144) TaxID=431595 RepID=K3WH85_GLOUD
MDAAPPLFHGIDLKCAPFLTKRGRKIHQIAKRIFVIIDGYLFYFLHAASSEPCGVIPLENAEYVVHSYASTEELSNFCFELRTPARPWGSIILHFHKSAPSKVRDVEQMLERAGARHRHEQFADSPQRSSSFFTLKAKAASSSSSTSPTRRSRLITLSGLSSKMLSLRRVSSAAALVVHRGSSSRNLQDGTERHSFLEQKSSSLSSFQSIGAVDAGIADAALPPPTLDTDTTSFICRTTSSSGRHCLLRVQHNSALEFEIGDDDDRNEEKMTLIPSSHDADLRAAVLPVRTLFPFRRRSTTAISVMQNAADMSNIHITDSDIIAEQELDVELCHELCIKGFVENVGRKLFHFMSPFWFWGSGGGGRSRSSCSKFTATIGGANGSTTHLRFATSLDTSTSSALLMHTAIARDKVAEEDRHALARHRDAYCASSES